MLHMQDSMCNIAQAIRKVESASLSPKGGMEPVGGLMEPHSAPVWGGAPSLPARARRHSPDEKHPMGPLGLAFKA